MLIPAVAGCLESRADGGGFPGTDGACSGHVIHASNEIERLRRILGLVALGMEKRGVMLDEAKAVFDMLEKTEFIPAVAGCLQERDAKGADSDTKPGHMVPVAFGGDVARTLAARHDSSPCADRGMDIVAVKAAQVQWASGGGKVHNPTAQALRSGAEHNYQFAQVGMQVRRLTPTECERLQGFPDNWTAGFSDSTRYKMLGNAVCVNVSEWIARRLMAVYGEGGRDEKPVR